MVIASNVGLPISTTHCKVGGEAGGWLWLSVSSAFLNLGVHRAEPCGRPLSGLLATVSSQLRRLHLNVRWQQLPRLGVGPWAIWEMMREQNPFHSPLDSAKRPWEPKCCRVLVLSPLLGGGSLPYTLPCSERSPQTGAGPRALGWG